MATLTYSSTDGWNATTTINYTASYNPSTNKTTITFNSGSMAYTCAKNYWASSSTTITVTAVDNTSSSGSVTMTTGANGDDGRQTYPGTFSGSSIVVSHSNTAGAKKITISGSSEARTYYYPGSNVGQASPATIRSSGSATVTVATLYTLTKTQGTGTSLAVYRGGTSGTSLSSGALISSTETLTVVGSLNTGYTSLSLTKKVGSDPAETIANNSTFTPAGNTTIASSATKKTYTMTLSAGAGTKIVVTKNGSTVKQADATSSSSTVTATATVTHFDALVVTFTLATGYNWSTRIVGGTSYTTNTVNYTVSGAFTVSSTATLKTYTMTLSAGVGTRIVVSGAVSKTADARSSSSTVTATATVTHFDSLTITFSLATGYTWSTRVVAGTSYNTNTVSHTVTGGFTASSSATLTTYTMTLSAGVGTKIVVTKNGSTVKQADATSSSSTVTATATVTHFDSLTIKFTLATGYSWSTRVVDGTSYTTNTVTYSVANNFAVSSSATLTTYTMTLQAGVGTQIAVTKSGTAVQTADARSASAQVTKTATVTHFDSLTITFSLATGYTWSTRVVAGANKTSNTATHTVSGAFTVSSSATPTPITLGIQTSPSGVTVTVVRTASPLGGSALAGQQLSNGDTVYYNDTLTILYSFAAGYTVEQATFNGNNVANNASVTVPTTGAALVVLAKAAGFVYINGVPYLIYIGNGSSWVRYLAKIGNGTSFDNY